MFYKRWINAYIPREKLESRLAPFIGKMVTPAQHFPSNTKPKTTTTEMLHFRIVYIFLVLTFGSNLLAISQTKKQHLTTEWRFQQQGSPEWLPAMVPGNVHTDLIKNQIIKDPFYRANEKDLQWIGEKDWTYKTLFSVDDALLAKENLSLVFQGLDTYADVYLNDALVLRANNMHREWRIDCKPLIRKGENNLRIHFKSVFQVDIPKYLKAPYKLQAWPNNDQGDMWVSLYARKAGYEYGWDWGPRLITSGIWRPVFLEGWNTSRINNVHIVQKKVSKQRADLAAIYTIESTGQKGAILKVKNGNKLLEIKRVDLRQGTNEVTLDFKIDKPKLWWSNGLGEPNLYTFDYSLGTSSAILENREVTTGIRTIKVVREKDKDGKSFYVLLNGVPIFIKGSNYIPIDNFLNRVTPERYETVIKSAKDANMNMLRVWGGGIYENDIFYDLCDRNGILVWQDMMFACGMFPSDKDFVENVKEEVIQNVTRLRNHPSIALWCGNNENSISWYGWGWKNKYPAEVQKEYEASLHQLFGVEIPKAISTVDTSRYYHPTSPNTGFNEIPITMGDSHYYGVWSAGAPFEAYNSNVARFMSEYGFQSFPAYQSVTEFTLPEDRDLDSPVMLSHQRAKDNDTRAPDFGNKTILRYMDMYFKRPKNFESFLYVSQILQAKGITIAIEAHRRNMPFCMGTLYWQLNDCWPVASWSSTDYYGRWKALHYAVKDAFKKELISIVNEHGKVQVHIASDRLEKYSSLLTLNLVDFDGKVISKVDKQITVSPNTSKIYFEVDSATFLSGVDLTKVVLTAMLQNSKETLAYKNFFFLPEKDLNLPSPAIQSQILVRGGKYFLQVKAAKFAKAVFLSTVHKDTFLNQNYIDLLPGEEKTIEINNPKGIAMDIKDFSITSLLDSYSN